MKHVLFRYYPTLDQLRKNKLKPDILTILEYLIIILIKISYKNKELGYGKVIGVILQLFSRFDAISQLSHSGIQELQY